GLLSRPESELTRKSQKLNRANTARLRGGEGKGRAREGKNMGFSLSHNNELNSLERGRAGADTPMSIQDFDLPMSIRDFDAPK
ncbi:MAG: hypothetical protein IKC51_04335, partial [Myxococcaceae bacterium]|nr:hypothetical protein [Myxococcaceae bacterium]